MMATNAIDTFKSKALPESGQERAPLRRGFLLPYLVHLLNFLRKRIVVSGNHARPESD